MKDIEADLVIAGAGMVGSSLALALKDAGLDILLLDAGPLQAEPFDAQAAYEPRVSALSEASRRFLQNLGAWDGITQRRVQAYRDMQVWDGDGTGALTFSASNVQAQVLGHIVENRVVQDALFDQLRLSGVRLQGESRLEQLRRSGNGWLLTLVDNRQVRTPLVIAADGANSLIRRLTGCQTREWDYFHHAIVTSVQTERPHQDTAYQRFTDTGPLAFLPLPSRDDTHWCSIVWSVPPDRADRLMTLTDDFFCTELAQSFEYRMGHVLHADPRMRIPLRQRHAKRYAQPGVAFIGDAAHVIHPLAGQGVNLGFFDAAVLAEVLIQALQRGENPADLRVLSRYERRRMPHNLSMMAAMEGFERLYQSDRLPLRWLRNTGMRLVDGHEQIKALLVRHALGLSADLPVLMKTV